MKYFQTGMRLKRSTSKITKAVSLPLLYSKLLIPSQAAVFCRKTLWWFRRDFYTTNMANCSIGSLRSGYSFSLNFHEFCCSAFIWPYGRCGWRKILSMLTLGLWPEAHGQILCAQSTDYCSTMHISHAYHMSQNVSLNIQDLRASPVAFMGLMKV